MASEVQRIAPEIEVRINGAIDTRFQVREVSRSAGGRSLDYAELELIKFPFSAPITYGMQDIGLLGDLQQAKCTIFRPNDNGQRELIHTGWIDSKTLDIDRSETQRITSRLQPYHFGEVLKGQLVWSPIDKAPRDSGEPMVFNPQLDGRVANNLSGQANPDNLSFLFMHPECQRTLASMNTNGSGNVFPWTLPGAVHYLCWSANPGQVFISNPTLPQLIAILPASTDLLRNHQQPYGEYLPANLDAVLEPYGFSWKIDLTDPTDPKIKVFRRGAGTILRTNLQKFGEVIDMRASNTEECHVTTDVANRLANEVEVVGDTVQIEDTFYLVPAWAPNFDGYPLTFETKQKLYLNGAAKEWETTPALARVWRDWVLNEAGDYTGLRPTITEFYNFNVNAREALQFHARRRKFLPCLTLGDDGTPIGNHHGMVVEFFRWDLHPTTSARLDTGVWAPIDVLSEHCVHIQILEKECGIRFAGPDCCPAKLIEYGLPNVRLRITATVEMDARVSWLEKAPNSANVHKVRRVIDVPSRFKRRGLMLDGKHYLKVFTGDLKSTIVDDTNKAKALAKELLVNWNQASINGTVSLPGTDWDLGDPIGRPFGGIDGRNINFQTTFVAPAKYPSVMGYKLDFVSQKTTLSLDTWRREAI